EARRGTAGHHRLGRTALRFRRAAQRAHSGRRIRHRSGGGHGGVDDRDGYRGPAAARPIHRRPSLPLHTPQRRPDPLHRPRDGSALVKLRVAIASAVAIVVTLIAAFGIADALDVPARDAALRLLPKRSAAHAVIVAID